MNPTQKMNLTDIATILGTVVTSAGLLAGMYKWAHSKGEKEGREKLSYARELETLQHLYAPLLSLLLDLHISSCTVTRYPTFRQRFQHAFEVLQERRFFKSKLKSCFLALFDKGISEPSVGIDHGSGFPTSEVGNIIKRQTHLAPPKLVALYRIMSREEYESYGLSEDELSACHLEFVEHVFSEHERLSKRVRSGK